MDFFQLLQALKARAPVVLWSVLVCMASALLISLLMPTTYTASAALILAYKAPDPVSGLSLPVQLVPNYVATQLDILGSESVALKVVDNLRLADEPATRKAFRAAGSEIPDVRSWAAARLLKNLEVTPGRESSVLSVSYRGNTPQQAAQLANAFAQAYQQVDLQLKIEPLKNAAHYFEQQRPLARQRLEQAQARYAAFQQEHGVLGGDPRGDVDTARLADLSAQLLVVQGQRIEAAALAQQARAQPNADSRETRADTVLQGLIADLARAQARLASVASSYQPAHPAYQAAQAEVNRLRQERQRQQSRTAQAVYDALDSLVQREAKLQAALAAQKNSLLELNRARDALGILKGEVDSAQRAFDLITQRALQLSLEGRSNQSDIAVLMPAQPAYDRARPSLRLNLALALVLGLALGAACAILRELQDRRVRSSSDLADVLDAPCLGDAFGGAAPRHALWSRLRRALPAIAPALPGAAP